MAVTDAFVVVEPYVEPSETRSETWILPPKTVPLRASHAVHKAYEIFTDA